MKAIDWTRADEWIDSYVSRLNDPNELVGRIGRTWLEHEAEKVGLVADGWGWEFGESHAVWYAALIKTGRLYKVNSLEKRILNRNQRDKPTTLSTVRKLLKGRLRDTVTGAMLRAMIDCNKTATKAFDAEKPSK